MVLLIGDAHRYLALVLFPGGVPQLPLNSAKHPVTSSPDVLTTREIWKLIRIWGVLGVSVINFQISRNEAPFKAGGGVPN